MGAPTQHTGKRRLISVQSVAQRLINTPRRYRGLVWVLLFSLLFIGLDGVFQKIFDIDLFRRRHMFSHIRVTASFINPNDLGSFLVTLLPLPLALLFSGIGRNVKVFLAAIFFIGIAVLLLTFSKGALAAFLLSLLFLAFCLRRRLVFLIFAVVIVLMFTLPLLFHGGCDWASRLSSFFSDCGVKDRIFLWRAALRMFLAHPFFGVGLGTFMENYQLYWIRPTAEISYAHNCYLQTLAETGIIGLGTFVAFLSVWVIRVCGVIRKQPPAGTKGDGFVYFSVLGLAAGLVAYLLNSFVDTNFYALPLAVLFWSVLGVQVAGMKILCRKE
ncbi:MAG: O-antigen ligase family protein [Candidatus Omnitrophota bacterium]